MVQPKPDQPDRLLRPCLNFVNLDAGTVCWDDHMGGITEILWLNAWGSVTAGLRFLSAFRSFNLVKIVTPCSISFSFLVGP